MSAFIHEHSPLAVALFNPDGTLEGVHEMCACDLEGAEFEICTDGAYATVLPVPLQYH